jgi:hypothetical protein
MSITRSSFLVALSASALVCGCFALFPLEDYGPNSAPADGGAADSPAESDSSAADAATGAKRLVFLTSERFNGSLGGIAGADNRCNRLAADAGIDGSFVAWLSSETTGAASRIQNPEREIVLRNGTTVAASLADLGTGGPRRPIVIDEKNQPVAAAACGGDRVWTNALGDGGVGIPERNCDEWSNVIATGFAGEVGGLGQAWTAGCPDQACGENARLYCFQK